MQRTMANMAFALGLGVGLIWACLWILVGGASVVQAQGPDGYDVYYVAPSCVGAPVPCYTSVQDAVDAVDDADDVVKVAAGTYTGVNVRPRNDVTSTGLVTQVVYISKSVTIRGGYTTTFTEPPDPEANPTTLDAQGQGRVLYITGDISSTIEGLRITGGDATDLDGDPSWTGDSGGGVYIISATVAVSGNHIFGNTATWGGGLFVFNSAATINDNAVFVNTGAGGGGGLLYACVATLNGNTVYSNVTTSTSAGLALEASTVTLNGNMISGNTTGYGGGGLLVRESDATINGNTITHNIAELADIGNSGGLALADSNVVFEGNIVTNNTASYGGGIGLYRGTNLLINNVVADNQANIAGSGIYVQESYARMLHTTIAHNTGGDGSGIHMSPYYSVTPSTVALTNTILVSHAVGIVVAAGHTATLEATLWGSGDWANGADWGGAGTVLIGSHNYWGDPDFIDPGSGDYHIGPDSAAIDAGVDAGVSDDIDGDTRPVGGGYDIGADERREPETLPVYLPLVLKQFP